MIKRRKGLSVICMLILVNNFIFSTGSAVIAKTTDENATEETQLENPLENKLLKESLLEPSATVNTEETLETTEEESPVVEASEPSVPPEATTETQEIETVEETEQSSEVVERKQAVSNNISADEPSAEMGDFTVTGGTINENYTYEDNVLSFTKSGEYQVTGKTSTDRIEVDAADVRLTLNNVKIDVSSHGNQAALLIAEDASATIDLVGENELISGNKYAGLQNDNDTMDSLVITSGLGIYRGYAGKLTAGGGVLGGAGIGGGDKRNGKVTITGGQIFAKGTANGGAGIGGGMFGSGEVTISGGYISAIGGINAGGIGGGVQEKGKVTISGGTITASNATGNLGIGNERNYVEGTHVTIKGGSVKALGPNKSTDSINPRPLNGSEAIEQCNLIPTEDNAKVSVDGVDYQVAGPHEGDEHYYLYMTKASHKVTVTNDSKTKTYFVDWDKESEEFVLFNFGDLETDNVTGVEYSDNELILSGDNQTYTVTMRDGIEKTEADRIKVTGKNVKVILNDVKIDVSSKREQAALLIDKNASATIDLVGKNELKSGYYCAGLQNDNDTKDSLVITSGGGIYQGYAGELFAKGAGNGAGIGGGYHKNSTVTIKGGSIKAEGGDSGAGIGGGDNGNGTVWITAGTINATGGESGAGIGSGYKGNGNVIIKAGKVAAKGGEEGAGIGGGLRGNGTIEIDGGTIIAESGKAGSNGRTSGAGIGGGAGGTSDVDTGGNGTVTIRGGIITANSVKSGAGIGGGGKSTGNVGGICQATISGGTVTANCEYRGVGIGNGEGVADAGSVTITGGTVKALKNDYSTDILDPRPTNSSEPVELCNLIPVQNDDTVLVDDVDYQVAGPHKDDGYYYLYMTKDSHKVTVTSNTKSQPQTYFVRWDDINKKFVFCDLNINNFTGVEYSDNKLTLGGDNQTYTVTMRDGITETKVDRIKVTGKNVKVILSHVKIDVSSRREQAALLIDNGASATIDLVGENELKSGKLCAGLQNDNRRGDSLVITSEEGKYQGYAGKLIAVGGERGSGIGTADTVVYSGGGVTINSGQISAIGGKDGPGMGGVDGEVIISDGQISAKGGEGGAGIGGQSGYGYQGGPGADCKVTINGGQIFAKGGNGAAGIGGGYSSGPKVTISGGTITAIAGDNADGIGEGRVSSGTSANEQYVSITGGSVKALGSNETPDSINPRPTSDGNTPIELYRANASGYSTGQPLMVGTTDWPIAGKHAEDDSLYLYLPKEKHVVTVGEQENFIGWQNEAFAPVPTYSLMIPAKVELTDEGKKADVQLTNEFYGVPGYNKRVTTSLLNNSTLFLKNQMDNKKQVQSVITYQPVVLPHNFENEAGILKLSPPAALDETPIQAGNYQGQLTFQTTLATEEGNP
ncbi:hypothetical protein [Enterococcus hulanensis]|uniref:hypothetical protein n=1 Tax=Enterococcus hulanensis TaxID=2559929 RepID=UPI0010F92F0C|nr:hypothetical protein [Enterococcus hulanensis]